MHVELLGQRPFEPSSCFRLEAEVEHEKVAGHASYRDRHRREGALCEHQKRQQREAANTNTGADAEDRGQKQPGGPARRRTSVSS